MNKKIALVFCFFVMIQLYGCQESLKNDDVKENDEIIQQPLCVLLDFDYNSWKSDSMNTVLSNWEQTCNEEKVRGFKEILKGKGGPTDITLKYVPSEGTERETFLSNLRIEIMAGKGPDVFLCNSYISENENEISEPIFKFPQKAMKNHVFLPLNSYIEKAQFMEWEKLTSVVMDAGSHENIQYLLPTGYTLYITCYKNKEFQHDHSQTMTWNDMVNDKYELKQAVIADTSVFCGNIFSPLADYSSDCLSFTEEDLQDLVLNWKNTREEMTKHQEETTDSFDGILSIEFDRNADRKIFSKDDGLTMIPVYSVQGGYSAKVTSFAAINANTKRPEDSFFIIDYWLSEECQTSEVYGNFLRGRGIPSLEGVMTEECPCNGWKMSQENYEELCNLRDNIKAADFSTPIDMALRDLLGGVRENEKQTIESSVHKGYMTMQMIIGES